MEIKLQTLPFSNNPETPNNTGDRHLLLEIRGLELEPGEKAHFTVDAQTTRILGPIGLHYQTQVLKTSLTSD